MRSWLWLAVALLLVPGAAPAQSIPQFESEVLPILSRYCTHCHGSLEPMGGLDLTNPLLIEKGGASGAGLVKHSPDASLIYKRLVDGSMPPAGQKKPSGEDIEVIRRWIGAGAPTLKFYQAPDRAADRRRQAKIQPPPLSSADREYWAFRKLAAPGPPRVHQAERVRTPVDAFLLEKLEGKGIGFSADAGRLFLMRRLYLDLIGLPPSPEEVNAFLADSSPLAYEQLVERLLASPHFGERWGRHWLDEAGYTDTLGGDNDFVSGKQPLGVPGKWKYRDYVIDAINRDKPYDRFVTEQLAGDELVDWRAASEFSPAMSRLLQATGFLRVAADDTNQDVLNTPDIRYGVLQRTVQTFASNVMGLTVGCAQCHDHKYDPISQLDYYRLTAVFTPAYNPQQWLQPDDRSLPEASPLEKESIDRANRRLDLRIKPFRRKLNALYHPYKQRLTDERLAQVPEVIREDLRIALKSFENELRPPERYLKEKFEPVVVPSEEQIQALLNPDQLARASHLKSRIAALERLRRTYGTLQATVDTGPPPPTYFLIRGNYLTPGPEVEPGMPAVLTEPGGEALQSENGAAGRSSGRRLALARRLTESDSRAAALVARVRVNRVWQRLFGEGIVATSDNLGRNGSRPTHPELLEWLADGFVSGGWQVKPLVRLLVTSTAYRQQSRLPGHEDSRGHKQHARVAMSVDPGNRLLWRMPLRRLESEAIRDSIMAVSGKLSRTMGGPAIRLDGKADGMVTVSIPDLAHPGDRWRRSLYLVGRRNYNLTVLSVFDQPKLSMNCIRRDTSAAVLQTLVLLNDAFLLEQARFFAGRVSRLARDPGKRIELAFRLALARKPSRKELSWSRELLEREARRRLATAAGREAADLEALASLCQMILNSNEFLHVG
ncbi:MAG: PSD1 and planctomycete cytochrome C domain-containing protein [Acidobacteriota bacterium]|nr:PSD1 and planctomycete cytochrome C domain-containing protein [Acidobacteriota bacterium]